jgi:hypothetical protein
MSKMHANDNRELAEAPLQEEAGKWFPSNCLCNWERIPAVFFVTEN